MLYHVASSSFQPGGSCCADINAGDEAKITVEFKHSEQYLLAVPVH